MMYEKLIYEDWSMYRVIQHLKELGIPSPRGLPYWQSTYLARMLREPLYKGEFIANRLDFYPTGKYRENGKPMFRYRVRPDSEWIRVSVPAIVTPEEWEQAQASMSRHKKRSLRNEGQRKHLLTGLLKCAYCGHAYSGCTQKKSKKHTDGTRYYNCVGVGCQRVVGLPAEERCRNGQVRAENLEHVVWREVSAVLTDPDRLMKRLEEREVGENDALYLTQLERIATQIEECGEEKGRWDAAYARKILELDDYEGKLNALRSRRRELEQSRKQLAGRLAQTGQLEAKKALLRERLERFRGSNLGDGVPSDVRRRILELVVDEIRVDVIKRKVEIQGAIRAALPSQLSQIGSGHTVDLLSTTRRSRRPSRPRP